MNVVTEITLSFLSENCVFRFTTARVTRGSCPVKPAEETAAGRAWFVAGG